jgi:hypothetical protein
MRRVIRMVEGLRREGREDGGKEGGWNLKRREKC